MLIKLLSLTLAFQFLLVAFPAPGRAGEGPVSGNKTAAARHADAPHEECAGCPDDTAKEEGPPNALCPFKYLVHFLWISFAFIIGSVIFIMDMSTGFSMGLTKEYIHWVKGVNASINRFFDALGCEGY